MSKLTYMYIIFEPLCYGIMFGLTGMDTTEYIHGMFGGLNEPYGTRYEIKACSIVNIITKLNGYLIMILENLFCEVTGINQCCISKNWFDLRKGRSWGSCNFFLNLVMLLQEDLFYLL